MKNISLFSLQTLTRLSRLSFQNNNLAKVPFAIRNISTLTYLSFSINVITQLECSDFSGLWQLKELDLSYNRLVELNSCVFEDLRSLQKLSIQQNLIYNFDSSFSFTLRNLVFLNAEGNIKYLRKGTFKDMSHLMELRIGKGNVMDDGAFDGLTNLRYLSYTLGFQDTEELSSRFIDMSLLQTLIITNDNHYCDVLPQDFLRGLTSLTVFSSSAFICKPHPEMFQHTPRLLNLEITKNDQWDNPDPELLKSITDLQNLHLSENHLKSLDIISEANLTKLEHLILSNNELRIIDEAIFKRLPSLKYLDLSGNPFVCNCSNAGFIYWVLSDKQVFVAKAFQYRCSYPLSHEGELLVNFNIQSCFESVGLFCFITSSSLVLLTLVSSFTYHFLRWQLVYGYYLFRAFLYDGKKKKEGCADVYDAFVSYNVHDEEWVYHELVPELEERQGWKLCLHHRDFEPEGRLDPVVSGGDPSDQLSPFYRMRKLVKSRTYLSWTQARSHRGLFWERVRRALESGNDPTDTHDPLTANV
uniref:TLR23a n=1 Tax=Mugilogobius chulae TaxID=88201 RepID=A0A9E8DBP6_9GOBI|nr:TLR23a [Mugilogobius chulae]